MLGHLQTQAVFDSAEAVAEGRWHLGLANRPERGGRWRSIGETTTKELPAR